MSIFVNLPALRSSSKEMQASAASIQKAGALIAGVAFRAPSYEGQFGPWVQSIAAEANARAKRSGVDVAEISRRVGRKAEQFAAADGQATQRLSSFIKRGLNWISDRLPWLPDLGRNNTLVRWTRLFALRSLFGMGGLYTFLIPQPGLNLRDGLTKLGALLASTGSRLKEGWWQTKTFVGNVKREAGQTARQLVHEVWEARRELDSKIWSPVITGFIINSPSIPLPGKNYCSLTTPGTSASGDGKAPANQREMAERVQGLGGSQPVEVYEVADGEYVVLLSGTDWGPDSVANGHSIQQHRQGLESDYERQVKNFLLALPPGAKVHFVGYSQGGIVANAVASNPEVTAHLGPNAIKSITTYGTETFPDIEGVDYKRYRIPGDPVTFPNYESGSQDVLKDPAAIAGWHSGYKDSKDLERIPLNYEKWEAVDLEVVAVQPSGVSLPDDAAKVVGETVKEAAQNVVRDGKAAVEKVTNSVRDRL